MTAAVSTNGTPRYRSTLSSPSTESVTLASPLSPVPVSDFEDIFTMSPIDSETEIETDSNAAPVPMSFEVPLGPLSGYGGAPKPVPKYKKPATRLIKPVSEQPDYVYSFKGYDADALVLTDQQINSLGQAVDGKQHDAEPMGQSSPLYGETDSDDSDPFIYDHIILPSSSSSSSSDYYNAVDDDQYNASDEGDSPSDNNSFEDESAFNSNSDDDAFEAHDTNNDDVGSEPDSKPPSSPSSAASGLYFNDEADSEHNNDDDKDSNDSNDDDDNDSNNDNDDDDNDPNRSDNDNDEHKDEEDERNNDDYYNPEDYFIDTNNYNYSDDNESGDSSSRCSNLDSHPLYLPAPIYAIAPYLTYQSPPTAPTMLPPVPHNTPLALPSNAPSTDPRYSDLGTLEILHPHIRNMIYGFVLADSPTATSEENNTTGAQSDIGVRHSTAMADRNNMLLVCWAMREEVLDFLALPFSTSGDE